MLFHQKFTATLISAVAEPYLVVQGENQLLGRFPELGTDPAVWEQWSMDGDVCPGPLGMESGAGMTHLGNPH